MIVSRPWRLASLKASWQTSTGFESASLKTGTPSCSPMTLSCSTAAGRWRSAATSSGLRLCAASSRASLPQVVVLPEPWRPQSIRITVGGRFLEPDRGVDRPHQLDQLVVDDLDDLLLGRTLLINSVPTARSRDRRMNSWTTLKLTSASSSAVRTSRSPS